MLSTFSFLTRKKTSGPRLLLWARRAKGSSVRHIKPRLAVEKLRDSELLFEAASDKRRLFKLTGVAGSVQVLFWANVAELWGRDMRDGMGQLAPLWQRGLVVSVCALVAGAFAFLAFSVSRHTVARLEHWPGLGEIRFATFDMFGRLRHHDPVPLTRVKLLTDAADSSKFISFRAPRAAGRPDRFYDLALKIDLRGTLHQPADRLRQILQQQQQQQQQQQHTGKR